MCRHENCRRESYRLVAFANEDDLWMHEIKDWLGQMGQRVIAVEKIQYVRVHVRYVLA